MMGGKMWVESEVGKGSTFHFTILAEAVPAQRGVYLRAPELEFIGKRTLIVDDNATNRRILTRQVQSWEMLPCAAASGPEALEWIRRGDPFDVAVLDMHMPQMDGLTLAAEIRKHRDPQALPLVMLTSLSLLMRDNVKKSDHIVNLFLGAFRTIVVPFLFEAAIEALFAHSEDSTKVPRHPSAAFATQIDLPLHKQFGVVERILQNGIDLASDLFPEASVSLQIFLEIVHVLEAVSGKTGLIHRRRPPQTRSRDHEAGPSPPV